jgi:hypothetical protein
VLMKVSTEKNLASNKASPVLALTLLAMQIPGTSGMAAGASNDAEASSLPMFFWTVVFTSMLVGATTALMLRPLALRIMKCVGHPWAAPPVAVVVASVQPPHPMPAQVVSVGTQTAAAPPMCGPDRIATTATGVCYHAVGCQHALLRTGVRVLRRCETCG